MLEPGEATDSERVKAQAGSMAIAGLHYAYEQHSQFGSPPPGYAHAFWDEYTA